MSPTTALQSASISSLNLWAILVAMAACASAASAQETPSGELNRQLEQAAGQSNQQEDVLNNQLNQAEIQADQQEIEVNDQIEESEAEVGIQESELERQIDRAETIANPAWSSLEERRPRLGIALDETVDAASGLTVGEIRANSAAATAGLLPGDVIVSIDGQTVATPDELDRFVLERSVGDAVEFIVLRDGERYPLTVTFEEAHFLPPADYVPRDFRAGGATRFDDDPREVTTLERHHHHPHFDHDLDHVHVGPHGWLGVLLQPSNPPYTMHGAGIVSVVTGGPAFGLGIQRGDRILAMNAEPIASSEHLVHLLSHTAPGDDVDLVVLREGVELSMTVHLTDASVFYHNHPESYRYHAGYHAPSHWHVHAGETHVHHEDLLEEHARLVEQQERIATLMRQIQSDITSIRRELEVQPTSVRY